MQYKANSPDEYLAQLEDDWRKPLLLEIRKYILNQQPAVTEKMQYSMLGYELNGQTIFNLNAQRNYVSLYVGDIEKVENGKHLLSGFNIGKGCIRVKKSNNLSDGQLEIFIKQVIDASTQGKDISC